MTEEQFKKAKTIEEQIGEYSRLIGENEHFYPWCCVKVSCAFSTNIDEISAIIPRSALNKMLNVLVEERQKLIEEFEAL